VGLVNPVERDHRPEIRVSRGGASIELRAGDRRQWYDLPKGDLTLVRNSFIAKPGQAGKLAAQLKNMAKAGNLRNVRVLTDLAGDFNHVIMEHEVESASEFEELITRYSSDPQAREAAKGYTDLWTTGRRELFRVA
jgi:hypothetical protein